MHNELVTTADGSHSLRSHHFGVPYHSVHGAVQESRHVFMEAGVMAQVKDGLKEIRILETGFGTGLNALLLWNLANQRPDLNISYLGIERYPVEPALAGSLNYPGQLALPAADFQRLHSLDWGVGHAVTDNFTFQKRNEDFTDALEALTDEERADVLFFDAFAPASQPELWEPPLLKQCYQALRPGGLFVTYCAKGQFKRDLRDVGFSVEPLPGPPGKREMTRGRKLSGSL